MPEKSLTGKSIKNSYEGLLHFNDGGLAGGTGVTQRKLVYDGVGNPTCLEIASNSFKINGSTTITGDVNMSNGSAGVFIRSSSGAIELTDSTAGSDNPYIDFRTTTSEDYDCRIIKANNGLQVWTGGNANQEIAAGFQSDQKLRVYGQILLGKNTGDGFPGVSLDATRVGLLDKLKLYSNDVISLYTAGTADANARLTVLANGNVGIGTTAPAKTLHVNGSLRLKVGGTEADGKVLTCTNSSGDVAWRNAPGTSNTPVRTSHNRGTLYQNTRQSKLIVTGHIDGGNDIWAFACHVGPNSAEVAVGGMRANESGGTLPSGINGIGDNPKNGQSASTCKVYILQTSDNQYKDCASFSFVVPSGHYYRMVSSDARIIQSESWEM